MHCLSVLSRVLNRLAVKRYPTPSAVTFCD